VLSQIKDVLGDCKIIKGEAHIKTNTMGTHELGKRNNKGKRALQKRGIKKRATKKSIVLVLPCTSAAKRWNCGIREGKQRTPDIKSSESFGTTGGRIIGGVEEP